MSRLEFRLPDIGEGLADAEIVRWLVSPGDSVQENQAMVEVETDKAVVTMPAPATGTVTEFLAQPGQRVKVGAVLVALEVRNGPSATAAPAAMPHGATENRPAAVSAPRPLAVQAAPAVRKLAADAGVALSDVKGTGPGGRITVEDVQAYARTQVSDTGLTPFGALGSDTGLTPPPSLSATGERVPVRGLRRRIAEAMTQSVRAIPHVCGFHEIDAAALVKAYERLRAESASRGVRVTYLAFIVKAAAAALGEHPFLNASYDEEGPSILLKKDRNIGIATATPDGLVVPVILHADQLSVVEIAREAERLAAAARARTLQPADLRDGTFTVTNVGAAGGWFGTSIIRYPEAAILGAGRIEPRAVVRDGAIVVRPILPLSLTFDHRVIDGDAALAFMQTLRVLLEPADSSVFGSD
jgi:pyruvate dehydrogenase E2 component (dihydrolipoamide acetyltransferase)